MALAILTACCLGVAACSPDSGPSPSPGPEAGQEPSAAATAPDPDPVPAVEEPSVSPVPEVELSEEEWVARMKAIPAELEPTLAPDLLLEDDPQDFPASSHIGGEPVEIVREYHSVSGSLLRIATVRPQRGDEVHRLAHGPSWIYHPSGALRTKTWWRDDVKHGPVERYRPVGTLVFEARFEDGLLEGLRREFTKAGKRAGTAQYREGELHGAFREWYGNGQLSEEAQYAKGEYEGRRRRWTRNGILVLDEGYTNGRRTGRYTEFHADTGQPKRWGNFVDGQRHGAWSETTPDGKLVATVEYAAGKRDGIAQLWDPSSHDLVERATYATGTKSGPATTWYVGGQRQSEGSYVDGARTGPWKYWREDGTLNDSWTGVYEDDARIGPLPPPTGGADGAPSELPVSQAGESNGD